MLQDDRLRNEYIQHIDLLGLKKYWTTVLFLSAKDYLVEGVNSKYLVPLQCNFFEHVY